VLQELQREGTPRGSAQRLVTYAEFSQLAGLAFHKDLDDRFGGK
jgi:hypothetical protein